MNEIDEESEPQDSEQFQVLCPFIDTLDDSDGCTIKIINKPSKELEIVADFEESIEVEMTHSKVEQNVPLYTPKEFIRFIREDIGMLTESEQIFCVGQEEPVGEEPDE